MHSKLNCVDLREHGDQFLQGGFCVVGKILGGDAVDEVWYLLPDQIGRAFDASTLDTTAVNVIPDAQRDANPAIVGRIDQVLQSRRVIGLLLG